MCTDTASSFIESLPRTQKQSVLMGKTQQAWQNPALIHYELLECAHRWKGILEKVKDRSYADSKQSYCQGMLWNYENHSSAGHEHLSY